jgi:hypothetical protein
MPECTHGLHCGCFARRLDAITPAREDVDQLRGELAASRRQLRRVCNERDEAKAHTWHLRMQVERLWLIEDILRYVWDLDRRMDIDALFAWCERLFGKRKNRDPVTAYNEIQAKVMSPIDSPKPREPK